MTKWSHLPAGSTAPLHLLVFWGLIVYLLLDRAPGTRALWKQPAGWDWDGAAGTFEDAAAFFTGGQDDGIKIAAACTWSLSIAAATTIQSPWSSSRIYRCAPFSHQEFFLSQVW